MEGDSDEIETENGRKAFRTLFPEEESMEDHREGGIHSPTFKQF